MTFSNRILVGLASGVAVGLFFGESAGVLKWAADGFVKLLQVTVLPYVLVSIVGSLGRLRYEDARALGIKTGAVLLGLWAVALVFTFLMPFAFPNVQSATFFSTSLIEERAPFNFVDLYIPSNPFYSLANNIVPAVVLFSALLGVALIGVERKDVVLDVLSVFGEALLRATRFVTRLTPYGLFAIAANAAGTLSIDQLGRLQVYLIVYVLVSLLFSLWVLPGLIAAVTPIRVRDLLSVTRDVLLTAFATANLFIVKGGAVLTPPLAAGLLPGITREFLFEVGADAGVPVREQALKDPDLFGADEVFLTSTTREIVPIVTVDDRTIGNGKPGPVTKALLQRFREKAQSVTAATAR